MTSGPTGSDGPHAFVVDLESPELSAEDRHHLGRVVRLRSGDLLTLSDAAGSWRLCRWGDSITVAGDVQFVAAPTPAITIAFALVKGQKPEWVVQKLTELGVDKILPFVADRSIVRWDSAKAEANTERLRRVAREASMQCRRCRLPTVNVPVSFAEIVALPGTVLAERSAAPLQLAPGLGPVAIGPEGGWTPEELAAAPGRVGLGGHILRADTAAMAAAALLGAARARAGTN